MSKTAKTSVEINSVLASRWSPRAFSDKPIAVNKLLKMFEAARWAPSSMNDQPWQFIFGNKGNETYQNLFETLGEFNQMWAKNAPALILCCGIKTRDDNTQNSAYKYDVRQAVAHLSIQAMSDQIYVHQMSGFSSQKAIELFEIPNHIEPLSILAIGYLGNPQILHPRMQKSEIADRERKPLNDFVFQNKFDEIAQLNPE